MHSSRKGFTQTKEMPAWFALNKYRKTSSFTAQEWHYELLIRKYIFDALKDLSVEANQYVLLSFFPSIMKRGIIYNKDAQQQKIKQQKTTLSVRLCTAFEILELAEKIHNQPNLTCAYQTYTSPEREILSELTIDEKTLLSTMIDDITLDKNSEQIQKNIHVTIDLSSTDEQILKEMQTLLTQIRKKHLDEQHQIPSKLKNLKAGKFSNAIFKEIARLNILPFIDIKLWEELSRQKISRRLLGKTLFPNSKQQPELRINDTMDKYYNTLMDSGLLHQLYQYAQSQ